MVKTRAADGTMLETAWESRRVPDDFNDLINDLRRKNFSFQMADQTALRTLKTAYSFKYPIDRKICQQDIREKTTFKQFKSKTYMQRYAWYVGEAKKSAGWMPWH